MALVPEATVVVTRPGYVRHFFVWPIERFEARDDAYVEDRKFYLLPFLTYHHHHENLTMY